LYDPTRRISVLRVLANLVVFFGVLAGYALLLRFVFTTLSQSYPAIEISEIPLFFGLFLTVAMLFLSAEFSNKVAAIVEMRLTVRHRDRAFAVHVTRVKPTRSGWVQLLELAGSRKTEWFNVQVTGPDLQEALKLADEKISIELGP
jgi:hypothetical protein